MADPLEEFFGGGNSSVASTPGPPESSSSPDVQIGGQGVPTRITVRPMLQDRPPFGAALPQEEDSQSQATDATKAATLGAAKAGFEAKDFFTGGAPDFADKSQVRKWVEEKDKDLSKESMVNGLASTLAQFGVGFVGLGKIKYVAKGLEWASSVGKGARFAAESARGAAAGGIFMDPHQDRLSNLVEAYPALHNPISNYLASRPEDGEAQGRLKNALEGIVMDVTLAGAITLVSKSIKLAKAGDAAGANAAGLEADAAFERAAGKASPEALLSEKGSDTVLSPTGGTGDAADSGGTLGAGRRGHSGSSSPDGTPQQDTSGLDGQAGSKPSAAEGGTGGPLPVPEVTPEQVNASLTRLSKDNAALAQHGSWDEAVAAGYRFKPEREGSGIIPWQKLRTTDETQAWMGQVIDDQTKFINARRGGGVLTDPAVQKMLAARVTQWGDDPAALVGALKAAGDKAPEMVASMETSFLIANRAYQDAFELAQRIKSDNFEGFGSRAEALAALTNRMAQATGMYANGKAIVTNSARALRRMRGEFKITDQQLANITNSDPEQLLSLVNATGGNPKAMADTGKYTMLQSVTDELAGFQAANLLWGWKTQVVNFATSAAMLVWRPLEVNLGARALKVWGSVKGDEAFIAQADALRRQSYMETAKLASVTSDGWNAAVKAFTDGDSILAPHKTEQLNAAKTTKLEDIVPDFKAPRSMDDVAHNALEAWTTLKGLTGLSLRTLGAADEMVKTMRYRAIILSKASLEAEERGLTAGSQEFKDYVSTKLSASTDDLGRGLDKDALLEAQTSTFQQDLLSADMTHLGAMSKNYSAFAARAPIARLITPFIKTPTNLLRYGVKLTPGVNLLQKEYTLALSGASGASGMEAQARATGQMMLGVMLASTAMTMWANGSLVGSGPQGTDQRRQWVAQGNRPNSIVWHDKDGTKQFLELGRFDPIGMPLVMLADFASILSQGHIREEDEHGLAMSLTLALSHAVKDKTYLKNLSDGLQAFTDDKKMEAWPKRFAPGFLPFSSLMSSVNPDPVQHEIRGVLDAFMAKTPGLSDNLPPQRDIFGDKVIAPTGFTSSQKNAGPLSQTLDQMFATTGSFLNAPAPKSAATGGVDLRDFTLKDGGRNAYDRYQELAGHPEGAPSLKDSLTDLVSSKDFQDLPNGLPTEQGTKAGVMMEVVKKYREGAWKTMLGEHDDLREAVYKRRMDIAGAGEAKPVPAAAAGGALSAIQPLLKTFGLSQ